MPETDGPPGAAVLGRALRRLGARVRYTSDAAALPPLEARCARSASRPTSSRTRKARTRRRRCWRASGRPTWSPSSGRAAAASGDYLNMRGMSVAEWNRPLDEMFLLAHRRRRSPPHRGLPGPSRAGGPSQSASATAATRSAWATCERSLAREGRLMARIASVVPVDHLVVAGVSNWGAYGIVAAARRGSPGSRSCTRRPRSSALIDACVEAGAVDGLTRRRGAHRGRARRGHPRGRRRAARVIMGTTLCAEPRRAAMSVQRRVPRQAPEVGRARPSARAAGDPRRHHPRHPPPGAVPGLRRARGRQRASGTSTATSTSTTGWGTARSSSATATPRW